MRFTLISGCCVLLLLLFLGESLCSTQCRPGVTRNVTYQVQHMVQACPNQDSEVKLAKLENQLTLLNETVSRLLKHQENLEEILSFYGKSCEDLQTKGKTDDGHYYIDVGIGGPLKVFCNFTHNPIQTIIEHSYPQKTEAKNVPNCEPGKTYGKMYNISYGRATKGQLVKFMESRSCSQFLRYDCHGSVIYHQGNVWAFWADRDGNKVDYWPGGPPNGVGCSCSLDKSCAGGAKQICECQKNDNVWRSDQGYITDSSKLPVSALRFCDTDGAGEQGFFTLGPLVCVKR